MSEDKNQPAGVEISGDPETVELGEIRKGTHVTPIVQVSPEDAPVSPAPITQNSPESPASSDSDDAGPAD